MKKGAVSQLDHYTIKILVSPVPVEFLRSMIYLSPIIFFNIVKGDPEYNVLYSNLFLKSQKPKQKNSKLPEKKTRKNGLSQESLLASGHPMESSLRIRKLPSLRPVGLEPGPKNPKFRFKKKSGNSHGHKRRRTLVKPEQQRSLHSSRIDNDVDLVWIVNRRVPQMDVRIPAHIFWAIHFGLECHYRDNGQPFRLGE